MPSEPSIKKRRYSVIYRIYRRIRYIRFIRRKKKKMLRSIHLQEIAQKKEVRRKAKEQLKAEKKLAREKARFEKEQVRKARKEIRVKLRENKMKLRESESELEKIREKTEEKKKSERRRRIRRLLRFWFKFQVRYMKRSIRSVNAETFRKRYRRFKSRKETRKRSLIVFLNSLTYSLLAYIVIYLIHQLAMVIAATFFQFPATLYYHEIYYHITGDDWTADAVKTIFLAGPLVALLIGIIFYVIYQQIKELQGSFKVFFLWGGLYAVSLFFGGALIGSLFETGMGYAISWMYIMDTGKVFTSIISLFFLFVAGLAFRKPFFFSANAYLTSLNEHNRRSFLTYQVLLPYLAVNVMLLFTRSPKFMFYESLVLITMFISLLPVIVTTEDTQDLYFEEEEKKFVLDWKMILATVLLVLFYRLILQAGIKFG